MCSQTCFHGLNIGRVQAKRKIIADFILNRLHHKLHQLGAALSGRSEVDVDPVHSLFFLPLGFLGYGFWIFFFEGLPDDRVDNI